jgi:hypothetical protein
MYQRRGYVRSPYSSQLSQSQQVSPVRNYKRYYKSNKGNAKENTALKMYRYTSNDAFARPWEANYKVVTIGDLFLGFAYGRPVLHLLHWKTAKLVCDGIYEKITRSVDKMDFRPFQYIGINNDEYPRWRVTYLPDIINALDWCRYNTGNEDVGKQCMQQIDVLQNVLLNGRQWGQLSDWGELLGLHSTRVWWADDERQVWGQVFPSTFWWLRERNAVFDGHDAHQNMKDINDPWNTTGEQVVEKNTPSFIQALGEGLADGIFLHQG